MIFKDKVLLITGGTGSFGHAVMKRFLESDLKEIRIFSRDEKKQDDMRKTYASDKLNFYLGDVRDIDSIKNAMFGVDYVFHAAALKQVPSCEFFPIEAVKTNIIGTENVLNASIEAGVKKVVCLSTDKAAYPINAMGISKAMMEKVFIAKAKKVDSSKTVICGTRYGNVMASRGSVIPLFVEQIKKGKPLTITDPNMTRFLMGLDEAVELVVEAFENAEAGDVWVKKSPASTIQNLAEALIKLFKSHATTQLMGPRHGEKLYETLITKEEMARAIEFEEYYRIPADGRDLNYEKYFDQGSSDLMNQNEYHSHNTDQLDVNAIIDKLKSIDYIQNQLEAFKG